MSDAAPRDLLRPARALLSLSDKTGLAARAQALAAAGVELISTGGTRAALADAGAPVRDVADVTGFPEMMDGRVKTLHPLIHGGILAKRDDRDHQSAMAEHGVGAIDLVAVNLYPFEDTRAAGADFATILENIDIGGPALLRAAAKNHAHVVVCVDGGDLDAVIAALEADGGVSLALRRRLAAKAYARTAAYDAAVAEWLRAETGVGLGLHAAVGGRRAADALRYGENPHQAAGLYLTGDPRPGAATARQIQGKALSYNNINDTDAAFELAAEFDAADGPAVVIVKHANPCGVAHLTHDGASLAAAHAAALACDPVSAFGGIVAVNQTLDGAAAAAIVTIFTEVVIAPDATEEALAALAARENVRVLLTGGTPDPTAAGPHVRSVAGGVLIQERDAGRVSDADLAIVTKRAPTAQERADMLFAWRVAKHVKSNAIVYAKDGVTAGVGAGQMSRVDAARIAARKAEDAAAAAGWAAPRTQGSACASDAFFPFPDGLMHAAEAGATAVIQPGGSIRDEAVIAAADAADLAMAFTGVRHFRH